MLDLIIAAYLEKTWCEDGKLRKLICKRCQQQVPTQKNEFLWGSLHSCCLMLKMTYWNGGVLIPNSLIESWRPLYLSDFIMPSPAQHWWGPKEQNKISALLKLIWKHVGWVGYNIKCNTCEIYFEVYSMIHKTGATWKSVFYTLNSVVFSKIV